MTTFLVPDMTCGHCKATIERAIADADFAARMEFDLAAHKVRIESALSTAKLAETLEEAGYPATVAG
ncbi:MAG: cation transporter [Proteobacteria bacterium]|nr:cation transporter [Pseudomonadota bacterium]